MHTAPRSPRSYSTAALAAIFVALAAALVVACGKKIGDGCMTTNDCSLNQDRRCDITQPGGYCTVPECTPDSCPDNALCIEFDSNVSRLARRFCMQRCRNNGDCRGGFACVQPTVGAYDPCPDAPDGSNASPPPCNRLVDTDGGVVGASDPNRPTGYCIQAQ